MYSNYGQVAGVAPTGMTEGAHPDCGVGEQVGGDV
jgi:hypothetical protein